MVYKQILQLLDDQGVLYTLHEHPPLRSVADVEAHLPFLAARMLKTVAFRKREGDWVLAGLRGHDRIDYRKLATVVGVNRRDIASLSPPEVEVELGFEVGGVAPFALRADVTLLFDRHLAELTTVFCGSGKKTITIEIQFTDLRHVTAGKLVDLVK